MVGNLSRLDRRARIGIGVVIALIVVSAIVVPRFLKPKQAFSLVDETALLVLKGTVQVQHSGSEKLDTVTGEAPLKVGDRILTADDGYAVVTYFDGSTTTIDPGSDITLNKLDKLPAAKPKSHCSKTRAARGTESRS